ncbi:ArpU family phage packaging/lysis transcriptional regulator [Paenibacillus sp. y28]|uniref:ArpU family phage packaging/lysis transcriptional regulator n=1 Tax=Paenibacillus sp. y28 TaxID=3129110 RepID=UPI00301B54F5
MARVKIPSAIDKKATRAAIEQRLESARIYRQVGFLRREMKTTASAEPRYHGATNAVGKPAEDVAVYNVDAEARMQEQYEQVERAVSRLGRMERRIIELRYLDDEDVFDYQVCAELHLSESKFYRLKVAAMYKLALALRLEVYLED